MCRHLARLGPVRTLAEQIVEPPHGLYRQAWEPRRQRHGTVNADGFGIGWYPPDGGPEPARYRRAVPIWADPNLPDLARTLRSGAVLAAVRDATPGACQGEGACAPFRTGRWLFSHNGSVDDWTRLPADTGEPVSAEELLGLEAHCDSALLWALVARRLGAGEPPGAALAAVVRAVAAVRPGSRLNLLLTDGRTVTAVRWGDTLCHRTTSGDAPSTVVASEPLDDGDWQDVPDRSLLHATPGTAEITPLTPGPRAAVPAAATAAAAPSPYEVAERTFPS
ncbi:ergothioneine biosynthesis protein EgtC [Streptomyces sp. JJ36]|uniref:ergothioneine biosynthesis protein EgtC n=1 Tax=Streptomyces sp. JJ36 TaxID=2736645 RepID=UPI001F028CE4|nr:ergothioneine biosynthesis protein EgtC [Streptomyces sp. JJ36]MCF6522327.1 ergothioneine biosynthesis protein EgtC [Streptomyces sp. JJ36]